jgi:hypothetical protein
LNTTMKLFCKSNILITLSFLAGGANVLIPFLLGGVSFASANEIEVCHFTVLYV